MRAYNGTIATRAFACGILSLAAVAATACSGPNGADVIIKNSILHAHILWACTVGITILAWFTRRRSLGPLALLAVMSVIHPVFTMNPWAGDCGGGMVQSSLLIAIAASGIYLWTLRPHDPQ